MMQQRMSKQIEGAEKDFKQELSQNPNVRINNSSSYKNEVMINADNREDFNPYN